MALSAEQKNDLRRRVLAGERLDVATSREIVEAIRNSRRSAAAAGVAGKGKKRAGKTPMSDAALDADLDAMIGKVVTQ